MIKEQKLAEKKAAQEKINQMRQQHNSSVTEERKVTSSAKESFKKIMRKNLNFRVAKYSCDPIIANLKYSGYSK